MSKLKVGIYGLTSCMGCILSVFYEEHFFEVLEKIDLVSCPRLKQNNNHGPLDIIFVEGTVVSRLDLKMLKDLRKRAKTLVAIGSCATDGCIPQIKHFRQKIEKLVYPRTDHLKSIPPTPLDKHVKVDYQLRGCPVDKEEFISFIKDLLAKKQFNTFEKPICHKCTLQENNCLLEEGKFCMGPITTGDCSVMCPHLKFGCIGCRGPYTDANLEKFIIRLEENGISPKDSKRLINKFAGIKLRDMLEKDIKQKITPKRYSMK